ncbi:MAG: hypothetical protein H6773_04375 [Pseudomonadales bacterium]|nr:hypothetical protein [Pseudomonadales bacterium]
MITINAETIRKMLPAKETVVDHANRIRTIVADSKGDKNMAQLRLIHAYGRPLMELVETLGGYLDMAAEVLPMIVQQAEMAVPAIDRGVAFMASHEGYETAVRAYLADQVEDEDAVEASYNQIVMQIGEVLQAEMASEKEIEAQMAPIVVEYGDTAFEVVL